MSKLSPKWICNSSHCSNPKRVPWDYRALASRGSPICKNCQMKMFLSEDELIGLESVELTIQQAISKLLEGGYDDGVHPLVGDVIEMLKGIVLSVDS